MAEPIRRCRPLLGTFVSIEACGCDLQDVESAFAHMAYVHDRMSFHTMTSDLARLRMAAWGTAVSVSQETAIVLRYAAMLYHETGGLFDVTMAPRLIAAGFLPRPPGIDLRHMTGNGADIEVEGDGAVRCHRPLLVDLGGIAKGYAVDLAIQSLISAGAIGAIVDAGGDLRAFGQSRLVGIRGGDGSVRQGIEICDMALATSANRHTRRRLRGAVATPHLDVHRHSVLAEESVTIAATNCMTADAFTKIALADRACAIRLLPQHDGQLLEIPTDVMQAA
jgi:thiamine biosynthesis lipoprotein